MNQVQDIPHILQQLSLMNTFGDNQYIDALTNSNLERPENISVYIHVPFCPQICHFCGCTTETGFSRPFLERYIDAVIKEIEFVSSKIR